VIIHPTDVHENWDRAKMAVLQTALDLGIECNCKLMTQWLVRIDGNERQSFLELAREAANASQ